MAEVININKKITLDYITALIGKINDNLRYFKERGYKEEVEIDESLIKTLEEAMDIILADDEF